MTYHLQQAAARHREQADAYDHLASLLQRIHANAEPAPIRELAAALEPMGLHIVPRHLLSRAYDWFDPDGDPDAALLVNQQKLSDDLRDVLHPKLAEQNPTLELPL